MSTPGWHVLVPMKPLSQAKRRTRLEQGARSDLACSMLSDVIEALGQCALVSQISLLTTDPLVDFLARRERVNVIRPRGSRGLNSEIKAAHASMKQLEPTLGVAVVMGDLPCLRPDLMESVLRMAEEEGGQSFVEDQSGVGTTMLMAPAGTDLTPGFGPTSAARHERTARRLPRHHLDPRLRTDVDTLGSLAAAVQLGVGPSTEVWTMRFSRLLHPSSQSKKEEGTMNKTAQYIVVSATHAVPDHSLSTSGTGRRPYGVRHARRLGEPETICGIPAINWVNFHEQRYVAGAPDSCAQCDQRVHSVRS